MKTYADANRRASGPQPIEHSSKPAANRFNHKQDALSTSVRYLALRSPLSPRLFACGLLGNRLCTKADVRSFNTDTYYEQRTQILIFWKTTKCIVFVQFGARITVWF